MTDLWIWIASGLLAGSAHVFAGPDHLAAVAPLAADRPRRTWLIGLAWGLGHSGGVWMLALAALALREALPVTALSAWSERLVGVLLVGIGLWGLRRVAGTRIHAHAHSHDGVEHTHIHVHDTLIAKNHPHEHAHAHGALGIGTLHGIAGTAHLLGVLPALALPSRVHALGYVAAFGLGSVAAMTAFAWLVGRIAARTAGRGQRAYRCLVSASCVTAIAVGAWWLAAPQLADFGAH